MVAPGPAAPSPGRSLGVSFCSDAVLSSIPAARDHAVTDPSLTPPCGGSRSSVIATHRGCKNQQNASTCLSLELVVVVLTVRQISIDEPPCVHRIMVAMSLWT